MAAALRASSIAVLAAALAACSPREGDEPAPPDGTLEEIRRLYEEAVSAAPEDPVGWAREDLEKLGDWEYRIAVVTKGDAAATEAALNELGKERWEVFWVTESATALTFYLKRPARSYLRMLPLSGLRGLIDGASSDDGE
ncbi:MAG: hypothetical protein ACREQZ_11230 [Woeseiaceae bacterium]